MTSPRCPERSRSPAIASWRKASIASQPPIEWASTWTLPTPGVAPMSCSSALQRVARGGGVVLVGDVAEQFVLGRPGEQHRDAAEPAVGDDLRGAVARLVERRVEAVDEDEHVAVDADAAGNMRSELGAEFVGVERCAPRRGRCARARLARAPHRLFDRPGVMAGRDREDVERVMHAVGRQRLRRRAVLAFAGRGDEDLHRPGGRRRDGRSAATRRRGRSRSPTASARRGRRDREKQAQSARRAPKPSLSRLSRSVAAAPHGATRLSTVPSATHVARVRRSGRRLAAPASAPSWLEREGRRARRPERRGRSRSPTASRRPRRPRRRAPNRARRTAKKVGDVEAVEPAARFAAEREDGAEADDQMGLRAEIEQHRRGDQQRERRRRAGGSEIGDEKGGGRDEPAPMPSPLGYGR